ncbi:hypothetical protein B0H14DRAFT_2600241 [Mycena olivaceomarginata]|nr:hypothetical protein B0H14DRAFT_2600241 [Mycena olivaceomarginata]
MAEQAPETEHKAKVTAQLLYHIPVTVQGSATGAKSKPKQREKKETKTKEFPHTFQATIENYHELLKIILVKHGEEKSADADQVLVECCCYAPMIARVCRAARRCANNWIEVQSIVCCAPQLMDPELS